MNLRYIIITLIIVGILENSAFSLTGLNQNSYLKAKVGCLIPIGNMLNLECDEQKIEYQILTTLHNSRRAGSKGKLNRMISDRAKHFLGNNEYDYMSVISLMVFPVDNKLELLEKFKKIPGKRAKFTTIAIERIQGKDSKHCKKRGKYSKIPLYLQEICTFKVSNI